MIKISIYDKKDFSMTRYNTDDFNLEVYLSVKARHKKEMYDLEGIKVDVDYIYKLMLQLFMSYISMDVLVK